MQAGLSNGTGPMIGHSSSNNNVTGALDLLRTLDLENAQG